MNDVTMYQYAFFVALQQGDAKRMQVLPIVAIGPSEVPAPEMITVLHEQLVRQAGFGAKRPTHYSSVQIRELPMAEDEKKSSVIALPNQNGAK